MHTDSRSTCSPRTPSLELYSSVFAGLLYACSSGAGDIPTSLRETLAPLAYDDARGVTVLFGGLDGSRGSETWEYDGSSWTLRATTGPSPRQGHALAYDAAHGVTVLFGGFEGSGKLSGETWEWDGTAWTLRTSSGPSPRYGHALAFDAVRGTVFLFGGFDGAPDGETWEYDGDPGRWTLRSSLGGPTRTRHALAYDAARNITVLFGGQDIGEDDGALSDETWEWNAGTRRWTKIAAAGPPPRYLHALVYDSARGVTLLFGGYGRGYLGDTWAWDGVAWTQQPAADPSPRAAHAMAFDSARGVTVLFGGYDGTFSRETWEWDGSQWSERTDAFGGLPGPEVRLHGFLLGEEPDQEPVSFELRLGPGGLHERWSGTLRR